MRRLALALFLIAFSGAAGAQTIWYVDVAGTPPGTGVPSDPYTSIQHAIAQPSTVAGDTVLVAAGTYFENVDFLGKAIQVRTNARAVIDASNQGSVASFVNGEGAGSVLDGFTLTHGRGTISTTFPFVARGGGVYCVDASPTLVNLVVQENIAQLGSGLYFSGSSATVDACRVQRNGGPGASEWPDGTGIWSNGPIQVTRTEIVSHDGTYGQRADDGGGVYGTGTYTDCSISGNHGYFGGGAYGLAGLTFVGCTFRGNMVNGELGTGGGIYSASGPASVTATDCSFLNNRANLGGGAYAVTLVRCTLQGNVAWSGQTSYFGKGGGALSSVLTDCVVSGNQAGSDNPGGSDVPGAGGGLWGGSATRCTIVDNRAISGGLFTGMNGGGGAHGSALVDCDVHGNVVVDVAIPPLSARGGGLLLGSATRCRIWDNSAPFGGGASDATLDRCTISGNTASVAGGGVAAYFVNASLTNSICWDNAGGEIANVNGSTTVTWSDVRGGYPGIGNIDQDPLFVQPLTGDFALGAGSPCINAGDPSLHDPDGSRIEMGAVPFTCHVGARCVGKLNSQGCTPAIGWTGTTSVSGNDDFVITGSGFVNQKSGLLFWGRAPLSVPFQGGTLCVQGPLVRTPIQSSGGNPLPPDCSGTFAYPLTHAYLLAHSIFAHQTIHAQWYYRDPAHPDGTGVGLSNAIELVICP